MSRQAQERGILQGEEEEVEEGALDRAQQGLGWQGAWWEALQQGTEGEKQPVPRPKHSYSQTRAAEARFWHPASLPAAPHHRLKQLPKNALLSSSSKTVIFCGSSFIAKIAWDGKKKKS